MRIVDQAACEKIRSLGCAVCCRKGADCAHIKTRGSGGDDVEWNMMPLCRVHHTEQHTLGWARFSKKYPIIAIVLRRKGWELTELGKLTRQDYANC